METKLNSINWRRSLLLLLLALSFTSLTSCHRLLAKFQPAISTPDQLAARVGTLGRCQHPFKLGYPGLAGLIVKQYPDSGSDFGKIKDNRKLYAKKHPAVVHFYFWDGRVMQARYSPAGTLQYSSTSQIPVPPGNEAWRRVDFGWGSDPKFKSHADPR
jgi:hypothetical protein